MESQKRSDDRASVVLQLDHSSLAGQLARNLLPSAFGDLPQEVIEAAEQHDLGWKPSDDRQLARAAEAPPKPFPAVREDELPSWNLSLEIAETQSPLRRCLISRHFSALANRPSPNHERFLAHEMMHRNEIETQHDFITEQLELWAGAVGFCDLVSLYLCSGLSQTGWFPLTHPAYPHADRAPRVTLTLRNRQAQFTPAVFIPGAQVQIGVLTWNHTLAAFEPSTVNLRLN